LRVFRPDIRRRIPAGGRNGELARVSAAVGAGRWRAVGGSPEIYYAYRILRNFRPSGR
jgi:hypothetical protein